MILADRVSNAAVPVALAGLIFAGLSSLTVTAQSSAAASFTLPEQEPSSIALPLPEDRGEAALEQTLKRLRTTASVLMIVAHPDDEDGALLTYLSRGLGVRCTLLTLTRGEGGQNEMGGDSYDALGLIRTSELLKADEYYAAKQLWGTEADFGFSKTQEEAFARWGHERVLYDAVLAVRRTRPQVILSTFVGGVTDGHGHHQVSGEIAQEAFKDAADPKVFPEQLKDGLTPWQPLAVYSMAPFAPVTDKGMFDYATGKWAPARFHNYVTDTWTTGVLSTDVTLPVGTRDATLGRSYVQIAREGWGMQKSQNGGANPALSGPATASYHLWAVYPSAKGNAGKDDDLFHNGKVAIDTSLAGLAPKGAPAWLAQGLSTIDGELKQVDALCPCAASIAAAHKLAAAYKHMLELQARTAESDLDATEKSDLLFALDVKSTQFETALKELLGLDLTAFRTDETRAQLSGFRGASADETPRSVTPGEEFRVRVHTAHGADVKLSRIWLASTTGDAWKSEMTAGSIAPDAPACDPIFTVRTAENAQPTAPYFTRPNTEQATYDLSNEAWRERSFAPWPLAAWAEFTFDGVPVHVGQVVQTLERVTGPGGVYEPLVVTPAVGVSVQPEARILPLDGGALPVTVTVHTQAAAEGTVKLSLPEGWRSEPEQAAFHRTRAGDTEPIVFSVMPGAAHTGAYSIQAVAHAGGKSYESGWVSVGYPGLRPYNRYQPAVLRTRKVDVKLAPGLRIGYVMGTGDLVPEAIEGMGAMPHLLSASEIASGDLSQWNVIVIGIRAYSARPELAAAEARLEAFVRAGGTLIVQYQSGNFPAPLPLSMGRTAERVVDETAPVKLLDPANRMLAWPNAINSADFDGWIEERGHSFLDTWDPGYTALTETADPSQNPQRGGLLVTHPGKGTYVYVAFALYRQLPELVPGSYRILANLLSAGRPE
ncbi:MAG TPA: PIG-L family deacetylase [Terracidiphilus sp.]|jgi:LmbE family N-acetylglucosaminyl deacetylase|nr:PIG-L family deacetylase [Terracidiphilus sp.]